MISFSFNDISSIKTLNYPKVIKEFPLSRVVAAALVALALLSAVIIYFVGAYLKKRNVASLAEVKDKKKNLSGIEKIERSDTEQSLSQQSPSIEKTSDVLEKLEGPQKSEKPDLTQLNFEQSNIEKVIQIFKDPNQSSLKENCKDYFTRALLTNGNHILAIYRSAQNDQPIIDLLFEKTIEKVSSYLPDYQKMVLLDHFRMLHTDLAKNDQDHFLFLSRILKMGIDAKNSYHIDTFFRPLFESLSDSQLRSLTHFIIKVNQESWKKLLHLLQHIFNQHDHFQNIIKKALFTTENGLILSHLYGDFSYRKTLCEKITLLQLKELIKYWQAHDKQNLITNVTRIIEEMDLAKTKEALTSVVIDLGIDLNELVKTTRRNGNKIHQFVCAASIIQILKSGDAEDVKQDKIANLADSLSSSKWPFQDYIKDRDLELCTFLMENCPAKFLSTILKSFSKIEGSDRLCENILLSVLANPKDKDKFQEVFSTYWSCWKKFDREYGNKCSRLILLKIESEELLRAVSQAIPHDSVEKVQIVTLLRSKYVERTYFPSGSTTYQVPLLKDILDGILPPLTHDDYLAYLHFISLLKEKEKGNRLPSTDQQMLLNVFDPLSDKQIEDITQHILQKAQDSWKLLLILMRWGFTYDNRAQRQNKMEKILACVLPTLKDPEKLKELWNLAFLTESVCKLLSVDQINSLIKLWHETLKEKFIENLIAFLNRMEFEKREKILINLPFLIGIKFDELCCDKEFWKAKDPLKGYLWAANVLQNILSSSDPESEKEDQILSIINKLNALPPQYAYEDDQRLFAAFLGRNCEPEQIPVIFRSILKFGGFKHRLVEGLLFALLSHSSPRKIEKIRKAFEIYWTAWKKLDHFTSGGVSHHILPLINSKEILEAVYWSIRADAADRKEIIEHLRKKHYKDDFGFTNTFELELKREIIDEVLPSMD